MTALLAATAVLLSFGAAWELAGALEGRLGPRLGSALGAISGGRAASLSQAAARLRLPERIARAGLSGRLDPAGVIAAKLGCAGLGGLVALVVVPVVPARLALAVTALLLAAGFVAPDALLERAARRRRARFVAALPDALDMLAVGAASGRSPAIVFGEIAGGTSGPLAVELGGAVAEIECGRPMRDAIEELRRRVAGAEVGALAAALERSRTYGSPLAEQLHLQATALRADARRRVDERASRAAPKIQLVVALVLVPSVLLMIVAAIVAHSDALFGQLQAPG
jgi:tight adherence protein C